MTLTFPLPALQNERGAGACRTLFKRLRFSMSCATCWGRGREVCLQRGALQHPPEHKRS